MNVPTIQELQTQIISSFESQFGTLARGLKSTYRTFSQVISGQLKLLYLYGAKIQRNILPDQADPESEGGTLERWGRARLGRNRFAATSGRYSVTVTGQIGGTIRVGLTYRATNGYLYSVESAVTLTATSGTVNVLALTPGLDGQLSVDDSVEATEPILNVDQSGVIAEELTTPIDAETIASYRAAIILSFQTESQGGASGDYRIWAADAQGVRSVYPNVPTPGNVDLYVEANVADSLDGEGTPSTTILEDVDSVVRLDPDTTKNINERGRLPLGVFTFQALAITTIDINFTIQGYTGTISDDTAIINAAIVEYLLTIRPYIPGADTVDLSTLYVNRIIGVIAEAIGSASNFTNVEMTEGSVATLITTRQFLNGDIPILGSLTINA